VQEEADEIVDLGKKEGDPEKSTLAIKLVIKKEEEI
jgi:hypothetical protein